MCGKAVCPSWTCGPRAAHGRGVPRQRECRVVLLYFAHARRYCCLPDFPRARIFILHVSCGHPLMLLSVFAALYVVSCTIHVASLPVCGFWCCQSPFTFQCCIRDFAGLKSYPFGACKCKNEVTSHGAIVAALALYSTFPSVRVNTSGDLG